MRICISSTIALLLLAAAPAARGQVLADRVPADAVAYAGWAGSDTLGPAYDASHLKAFLNALNLPNLLSERMKTELARSNDPQRADDAKLATDLFTALSKSPTALYFGPVDFSNLVRPVPRIALFSKVGAAVAEPLAEKISLSMARTRGPASAPSGAIVAGDFLLIYLGDAKFPERLSGPAPERSLQNYDAFKKSIAGLGPDASKSAAFLYADGEAVIQLVGTGVQMGADVQARQLFPAIVDGTGLSGLRHWAWAGGFDGADWRSTTFMGMRDRRAGLLAFFDNKPLSEDSLRLVPQTATSAGSLRFDGMRLLEDVTAAAAKVNADAPKQLETVLTQAYIWTGIDLKRELFPAFGDEFIYYTSPAATGSSLRGFTLVNRLKDAKKADSAITAIENFCNLLILQRDVNSKVQFKPQPLAAPFNGFTAHAMALPQATPCWAIHNNTFYFSFSLPALQSAMEMGAGGKPNIMDNPQFAALRKRVGQESFASFSFNDLPASSGETYNVLNTIITSALAQNAGGAVPAPFALPPLDKIQPALSPALSVSWSDGDGYHARGISPFPGAGFLSPSSYLWALIAQQVGEATRPRPNPVDKDRP